MSRGWDESWEMSLGSFEVSISPVRYNMHGRIHEGMLPRTVVTVRTSRAHTAYLNHDACLNDDARCVVMSAILFASRRKRLSRKKLFECAQ